MATAETMTKYVPPLTALVAMELMQPRIAEAKWAAHILAVATESMRLRANGRAGGND
jgi:hypothetical protein